MSSLLTYLKSTVTLDGRLSRVGKKFSLKHASSGAGMGRSQARTFSSSSSSLLDPISSPHPRTPTTTTSGRILTTEQTEDMLWHNINHVQEVTLEAMRKKFSPETLTCFLFILSSKTASPERTHAHLVEEFVELGAPQEICLSTAHYDLVTKELGPVEAIALVKAQLWNELRVDRVFIDALESAIPQCGW